MTRLLICGFGAFPGAPRNPAQAVVERLAAAAWGPSGVETGHLVLPVAWDAAAETAQARIAKAAPDAVLLVGVSGRIGSFHVETLARNRAALDKPDAAGACRAEAAIAPQGGDLAVRAPVEAMLAAVIAAGLPAELSDDAGDYLCNFTLYRLLAARAAARLAFLHTPQARECEPGAAFGLDDVEAAVRAAAQALVEA